MTEPEKTPFAEWAIVELMGHRRLAGWLTEYELAGEGLLRLDIPGDQPATQLYSPRSVYCITPTTEDIARSVAASNKPVPVQRWELPAAPSPAADLRHGGGFDDDGHF